MHEVGDDVALLTRADTVHHQHVQAHDTRAQLLESRMSSSPAPPQLRRPETTGDGGPKQLFLRRPQHDRARPRALPGAFDDGVDETRVVVSTPRVAMSLKNVTNRWRLRTGGRGRRSWTQPARFGLRDDDAGSRSPPGQPLRLRLVLAGGRAHRVEFRVRIRLVDFEATHKVLSLTGTISLHRPTTPAPRHNIHPWVTVTRSLP